MTIKKPMKAPEAPAAVPAPGGATIADRFKLDVPDPSARKPAGKSTVIAVVAAFIALVAAGILAFVLYKHLEFLGAA